MADSYLFLNDYPFINRCETFANFIDGGKTLLSKDLFNSEYKTSVKMSEFDLITFVGISIWYIGILKCFR